MKNQSLCKWRGGIFFIVCISFMSASSAFGAGFALIENGVSGLGNAYAGGAASAEDASTIFYNPAGMTRLEGKQVIAGAHIIMPSVKFNNEGSTHVLQPYTGIPLQGGNGGDSGVTKAVPNFYYTRKLSDRFAVGLGVSAPFGLATEYDKHWVGRYHAIESDLLSVNINPSVAYKVNDNLSVGAGISVQYLKAKLTNAIDFGSLDFLGKLGLPPHALGLTPQEADGHAELNGDSWGVGYNIGFLYEFTKNTRMGIAYRSRIDHTLDGRAEFSGVPPGLAPVPVFKDTDAEAEITVPDNLSISFFHQINPQWMIMADFTWTNWQLFEELKVKFDNHDQPDAVTTENWQDSYRTSLGVTFMPDNKWTFRAGTAYDSSAVSDKRYRTPRIPDGDRIWAALGIGYKFSNMFKADIAYAHLFINDPEISQSVANPENAIKGGLKGYYDAHINIVSASLTLTF
ncbi:MAG: outer membrane protein transport protein [Thermodesulfovibrionales bacterium]